MRLPNSRTIFDPPGSPGAPPYAPRSTLASLPPPPHHTAHIPAQPDAKVTVSRMTRMRIKRRQLAPSFSGLSQALRAIDTRVKRCYIAPSIRGRRKGGQRD
jgi:hypothetical protein